VILIHLDEQITVVSGADFKLSGSLRYQNRRLMTYGKNWGIPANLPIFFDIPFEVSDPPMRIALSASARDWADFYIGYTIHAPGVSRSKFIHVIQCPRGRLCLRDDIAVEQ
jgi:hypothetical protein